MALKSKNLHDFNLKMQDPRLHGDNTIIVRGGATVVDDRWVVFNDLRIDVKSLVQIFVTSSSRRLFNNFNDVMYVLIVLDKYGSVEVIPNLSYSKKAFGDAKVFPDLSGKMPLVLVKLTQDGSSGLTGIMPIQPGDIELYQGYGNFTLKGPQGATGLLGDTGYEGITGSAGITGMVGNTGAQGQTGLSGNILAGVTGVSGVEGAHIAPYIPSPLSADFISDRQTVSVGQPVSFENLSTGPVIRYTWNFGDSEGSPAEAPVHIYSSPGIYTVGLLVYAFDGETDTKIRSNYIQVS